MTVTEGPEPSRERLHILTRESRVNASRKLPQPANTGDNTPSPIERPKHLALDGLRNAHMKL